VILKQMAAAMRDTEAVQRMQKVESKTQTVPKSFKRQPKAARFVGRHAPAPPTLLRSGAGAWGAL